MKGPSGIGLYKELESSLPASTEEDRKIWATRIVEQDLDLSDFFSLLKCDYKIASRFLWLLGRIGMEHPEKLLTALPSLLKFSDQIAPKYKTSFANYWLLSGVPQENEGQAIDLLFKWLLAPDTNVTIKSRSASVLLRLIKKYPELRNELKLCLEDQMDKYSKEFKRKSTKIIAELDETGR